MRPLGANVGVRNAMHGNQENSISFLQKGIMGILNTQPLGIILFFYKLTMRPIEALIGRNLSNPT